MLFKVKGDLHFEGEVHAANKEEAQERTHQNLVVISYRPQVLNISEFECELDDDCFEEEHLKLVDEDAGR